MCRNHCRLPFCVTLYLFSPNNVCVPMVSTVGSEFEESILSQATLLNGPRSSTEHSSSAERPSTAVAFSIGFENFGLSSSPLMALVDDTKILRNEWAAKPITKCTYIRSTTGGEEKCWQICLLVMMMMMMGRLGWTREASNIRNVFYTVVVVFPFCCLSSENCFACISPKYRSVSTVIWLQYDQTWETVWFEGNHYFSNTT